MDKVDPKIYNLPPRTVLLKDDNDNFILFIDRKSRIIFRAVVVKVYGSKFIALKCEI